MTFLFMELSLYLFCTRTLFLTWLSFNKKNAPTVITSLITTELDFVVKKLNYQTCFRIISFVSKLIGLNRLLCI